MSVSVTNTKKTIEILHVENSFADILLMKEVVKRSNFPIHLTVARTGEKALEILKNSVESPHNVKPDLILLDMKLSRSGGREVLGEIRASRRFQNMPIIIMGMSKKDRDAQPGHKSNYFIAKPSDMGQFEEVIIYIDNFLRSRVS
jgi:CheY-like chemotaxis protein